MCGKETTDDDDDDDEKDNECLWCALRTNASLNRCLETLNFEMELDWVLNIDYGRRWMTHLEVAPFRMTFWPLIVTHWLKIAINSTKIYENQHNCVESTRFIVDY